MADKNSLVQYVVQKIGPEKLKQMVDQIEAELSQDPDVTPEALAELEKQLNFVAENPDRYKEVITAAAQAGMIDPNDVPPEFDPVFIAVMLIAVTELQHRVTKQGSQMFAKGGLARQAKELAAQGRGGDTILAHINPREAEVLRRMGGAGTINPNTGLREFKKGLLGSVGKIVKSVAKAVVPIAATAVFGPAGGALAGAAMGAIGGGGLKGALLGGITGSLVPGGYLGDIAKTVGSGITSALPSSIGNMVSGVIGPQTLGAGVLGGLASAATGQGFLPGALTAGGMAAATPSITNFTKGLTGAGGIFSSQAGGTGVNLGATGTGSTGLTNIGGNILSSTGDAAAAGAGAGSSGLGGIDLSNLGQAGTGVQLTPFNAGAAIKDATTGALDTNIANAAAMNTATGAAQPQGALSSIDTGTILKGAMMLNALSGANQAQAQTAIDSSSMSPEQKAAMSRALTDYTANWNTTKLPTQGTPEYDDMMNKIYQGIGQMYIQPTLTQQTVPGLKAGGALSMLARGTGSGRDDTIDAKLSDGEYVIDAETVALLGNGSTKAGAAALDQMREQIRKQKGKALAKGKFSPDAKSPLAYLKGRA